MTAVSRLMLAAAGALLLSVPAMSQDAAFTKKGASPAAQKRDSARCWKVADKTRLTDDQAAQNLMTGYLVGGIVGVLIVSSTNDEANKDPRSGFKRQVHDDCMAGRGYRKVE